MFKNFLFVLVAAVLWLSCNGEPPRLPDEPRPPKHFSFNQFGTTNYFRSQVLIISGSATGELQRFPFGSSLTAYWNENTEPDLDGYNVYVKKAAAETIKINAKHNAFVQLPALFPGVYFLTATAYDTAGNESLESEGAAFEIYSVSNPDTLPLDSLFDSFDVLDSAKWTVANNSKSTVKVSGGRLVLNSRTGESGWLASRKKLILSGHNFKIKLQGTGDFAFGISTSFDANSKVGFYNQDNVRFYIASTGQTSGLWYQERRVGMTVNERLVAIDERFKTSEILFEIKFSETDSTFWRYSFDGNIWKQVHTGKSFFQLGPIVHIEFAAHKTETLGTGYVNDFSFEPLPIVEPPKPPQDTTLVKIPLDVISFWFIVKPDSFDTKGVRMDSVQIGIDAELVRLGGAAFKKTIYPPSPKQNFYYIHRDSMETMLEIMNGDTLKFQAFQRNSLNGKQSIRLPINKRFIF